MKNVIFKKSKKNEKKLKKLKKNNYFDNFLTTKMTLKRNAIILSLNDEIHDCYHS